MEDSIAQAWNRMVDQQKVRPEEIKGLVDQVLKELQEVARGSGRIEADNRVTKLPYGIQIFQEPENLHQRGVQRSSFHLWIESKRRTGIINAEAGPNGPPSVSDPTDKENQIQWTEQNGPQKEWILQNLREQVITILDDAQADAKSIYEKRGTGTPWNGILGWEKEIYRSAAVFQNAEPEVIHREWSRRMRKNDWLYDQNLSERFKTHPLLKAYQELAMNQQGKFDLR